MDYEKLKEVIAKQIKENGRREITGPVLQAVLMAMVDSLGEVYPQTYTDEEKAQARANIDALSDHNGEITKEKLSLEVQAILDDVANKQNITDESLATIAKTIVGAINEVYNGGVKDASIATSKIEDGAITEPKLDTDLVNVITSAVQPAELASAIATALASYVAKADIVDTTGSATDKVMSQHGVTEAIDGVTNKVTELEQNTSIGLNTLDSKIKMGFEVEDILPQISNSFVPHKYPVYGNGAIATAGSSSNPVGYYIIPLDLLQNYFSIRAYLQCDGPIPAAIAFYSSEDSYTKSTYLGGIQHEKTSGKWFEIEVPNNAKSCLITNRPTSSSSIPIILVLKKEKIVKEIIDIQEHISPKEYTESLIGTVNIAANATKGNLVIDCFQNEIIKLVIDNNCRRVDIGTTEYGSDVCHGLAPGIYYLQLQQNISRIYFYRFHKFITDAGTIQIYKCSDKSLFDFNPLIQSFYKYKEAHIFNNNNMILNYQWNVNTNNLAPTGTDATTGLLQIHNPNLKITLSDTTNYKFFIISYSTISPKYPAGYDGRDSGWQTDFDAVLPCCSFAITLRKTSGGKITQEDLSVLSIEFKEPYLEYYTTKEEVEKYVENKKGEILNLLNPIGSINNGLNITKPYYYHFSPNSFINDGNGNNAIPSQTVFDIEVAARLGFTFIEANIHNTSDGNFICMHGSAAKFGTTVYSLDGTDISNVAINTKTLNWIKENVRFNSYYDKYKVAPLSLEEFCKCCKVNGIGVFAGTNNLSAINICMRILGTDNIMLYNADSDKRQYFKGMMFVWNNDSDTTAASILDVARQYGIPFMYGLGPDLLSTLVTNDKLNDLCIQMHNEGFTLASTAVYDTEINIQNAFEAGVDFSASGHQVNLFENADIIYDLNDSTNISGTGAIENGMASLANGETLICGDDNLIPLGKGMLIITFNGALTIDFGSQGSRVLSSDGVKEIIISDYFFKRKTKLTISATDSTTIKNLIYKIKKC